MSSFIELLEQVEKHLESTHQNWLFGAGISFNSNIPLMHPMTKKIENDLSESSNVTYKKLKEFLTSDAHIEHYLSHIGDLLALLDRSRKSNLTINNKKYTSQELEHLYDEIIIKIGDLVRFGYNDANNILGDIKNPIVTIDDHSKFIQNLFNRRSNLEYITNINFFTTNYDTLLEDALALHKKNVVDGFTGGSVGYWDPNQMLSSFQSNHYKVIKLHGSIDWYKDDSNGLIRCRYGTKYLSDNSNLLIYPQATKYLETQKDPFAFLFSKLRESISVDSDKNVIIACGYSFGDNHINQEIEIALSTPSNKTTLLIFIKEEPMNNGEKKLPLILSEWLENSVFSDRMYVLTDRGIYNSSINLYSGDNDNYDWWTFQGLTNFLD